MRGLVLVLSLVLGACATAPVAPINAPLGGLRTDVEGRAPVGDDLIVLALSGGGARAASFHLGVLQALRDTPGRDGRPLSEHIALITSVSGGSVLAAYYGLHGDAGLDTFDAAYLGREWRVRGPSSPFGIAGALRGGMNGPQQLRAWLAENIYGDATIGDMRAGPRVILNATDLYNSTPFAFTQFFFDGLCSDVRQVRVADAVAASMAVPVAFRPVVMESYGARCPGPPAWTTRVLADRNAGENVHQTAHAFQNYRGDTPAGQRYVHLVDGGVADNLGMLSLQVLRAGGDAPSPLSVREALQARRVLFLVVNAEYIRPRTFQQNATDAIGAYEMMYSPVDVATEVAKRASADVWRAQLPEYQRALRDWRCGLVEDRRDGMRCDDITLSMDVITFRDMEPTEYEALYDTATDVSLPRETVDALTRAGRGVVGRNAALAAFRQN
ncbi:MAG: patatin-like phospholipase family protein [Alphaproteobacteria bacterium]|nr:patatin-like phospholipase family protein [Alphaproteobacteria bacterium]